MTNKTFAKIKAVLNKEIRIAPCLNKEIKIMPWLKKANKKTVTIVAIAAVAIVAVMLGVFAAHEKNQQRSSLKATASGFAGRMGKNRNVYPLPAPNDANQFVLPENAAKSGELAIIVSDLDSARNSVAAVAAKNGGIVYATFISYASDSIKNGSIVVQVPAESFDAAFAQLKKVGSRIVQESTMQIPQRNIYPYPVPMAAESVISAESVVEDVTAADTATNTKITDTENAAASSRAGMEGPPSLVMPEYYQQSTQDKGYIKVVFADYGTSRLAGSSSKSSIGNMIGVGYSGLNMRNNFWVVLAVKSILLIVLIFVLVIVAKKILQNYRKARGSKLASHVVRQMAKTRPRVVRIKKK